MKCKIRSLGSETNISTFSKWTDAEVELNEKFYNARDSVHNALCGTKIFANDVFLNTLLHIYIGGI